MTITELKEHQEKVRLSIKKLLEAYVDLTGQTGISVTASPLFEMDLPLRKGRFIEIDVTVSTTI